MPRPPALPAERKAEIILAILSGEISAAEAARTAGVSGQAVSNWKRRFIEAGRDGLDCVKEQHNTRELELLSEIRSLKGALGESYMQLRELQRKQVPARRLGAPLVPVQPRSLAARPDQRRTTPTTPRPGPTAPAVA